MSAGQYRTPGAPSDAVRRRAENLAKEAAELITLIQILSGDMEDHLSGYQPLGYRHPEPPEPPMWRRSF
jgi:hypothetical protein